MYVYLPQYMNVGPVLSYSRPESGERGPQSRQADGDVVLRRVQSGRLQHGRDVVQPDPQSAAAGFQIPRPAIAGCKLQGTNKVFLFVWFTHVFLMMIPINSSNLSFIR